MPEITQSTTVDFTFQLDWSDDLREGDFIEVENGGGETYVAQVTQMKTSGDHIKADATLLGSFPPIPFRKGTEVNKANKETVFDALNLPKEGLYIGDIRSFDAPVYLDVEKTMEKHIGIFGRTASGKSYTAAVLAEELLENQQSIIIIDPHGEYASLAVQENGDPADYRVVQYGDPELLDDPECKDIRDDDIEYTDFARTGQATILNLKGFNEEWRREFVDGVLDVLYNARTRNQICPTKVFIDEAHQFAGRKKSTRCDRIKTVASEGRKFGFTLALISQRPASIDASIRSQLQTLTLHKLTDDTDVSKAIETAEGIGKTWKTPIQQLDTGECIMAGDLLETPLFVSIRERHTKHHSSTGKAFTFTDHTDPEVLQQKQEELEQEVTENPLQKTYNKLAAVQEERDKLQKKVKTLQQKDPETDMVQEEKYNTVVNNLQSLKEERDALQDQIETLENKLKEQQSVESEHKETATPDKGQEDFGLNDPSFIYDTIEQIQDRIRDLPEVQQKMLRWFRYNEKGRAADAYANAGRSPNSSKRRDHANALKDAGFLTTEKQGRKKYYVYALEDIVEKQVGKAVEEEYIPEVVSRIETAIDNPSQQAVKSS